MKSKRLCGYCGKPAQKPLKLSEGYWLCRTCIEELKAKPQPPKKKKPTA